MANGDAAIAAGMDVVLPTADRRLGYDEINKTRDYIAQRTNTVTPIDKGGTGATTADTARANLGIPTIGAPGSAGANVLARYSAEGRLQAVVPSAGADVATKAYVDGGDSAAGAAITSVAQGNMTADVYNRTLGGSYRVLYVASNGLLGWVPSSRRHKKNIKPADVDPAAVLSIELVTFLYKVSIDTEREGIVQHGLIAEQLDELGLDWLVDYGPDGTAEGVRYDRLALALLPVVQNLNTRLTAIETHLDALGGM